MPLPYTLSIMACKQCQHLPTACPGPSLWSLPLVAPMMRIRLVRGLVVYAGPQTRIQVRACINLAQLRNPPPPASPRPPP